MKYLVPVLLAVQSVFASSEEAKAKAAPPLPETVVETRIKVTIEFEGKVYRLLVPKEGQVPATLYAEVKKAGIETASRQVTKKARENGGEHIVFSCLKGNYILVPVK